MSLLYVLLKKQWYNNIKWSLYTLTMFTSASPQRLLASEGTTHTLSEAIHCEFSLPIKPLSSWCSAPQWHRTHFCFKGQRKCPCLLLASRCDLAQQEANLYQHTGIYVSCALVYGAYSKRPKWIAAVFIRPTTGHGAYQLHVMLHSHLQFCSFITHIYQDTFTDSEN